MTSCRFCLWLQPRGRMTPRTNVSSEPGGQVDKLRILPVDAAAWPDDTLAEGVIEAGGQVGKLQSLRVAAAT